MARVYIETYGCTLNQADSDIIRALLKENFEIVESAEASDVVVINTCTVKGVTENKILSRMKSLGKKLVVAGCMKEERIRTAAPIAPIVGPSSISKISLAVADAIEGRTTVYKTPEGKDDLPKTLSAPIMRIPINEGCLSSCNFCQTKLARPFLRSYRPRTIMEWIDKSTGYGANEIQLTSMDSGAYGRDIRTDLVHLLDSISRTEGDFWVRLGMINPDHARAMLPDILRAFESGRFYRFLHVPVQTGSEKVCREMNRDHTVDDYVSIVQETRSRIPETSIATDVIVGYPTETEDDFEQTLDLLKKTTPEVINLSKFSPRPGTKAKELRQLPSEEIKRRSKKTSELVKQIHGERRRALIGKRYKVLITEKSHDFKARNINYHQVVVKNYTGNLGDFAEVKIADANNTSLFGEII